MRAKKVVFLTKEYDEIHLVVEVVSEKLVFQPRWNVVITELDKFKYEIKQIVNWIIGLAIILTLKNLIRKTG